MNLEQVYAKAYEKQAAYWQFAPTDVCITNDAWIMNLKKSTRWWNRMFGWFGQKRRNQEQEARNKTREMERHINGLERALKDMKSSMELLNLIALKYDYRMADKSCLASLTNPDLKALEVEGFRMAGHVEHLGYDVWVKKK